VRSGTVTPREFPLNFTFLLLAAVFLVGYFLYAPAFNGPFIFDDSGLPFYTWNRESPVSAWVSGVRPALMFSYWMNRYLWGDSAGAYHAVNLFIHIVNAGLVFLALWRLLGWHHWDIRGRKLGAASGALLFLIHPLQTESVSYIAGRSESLSTLFVLAAYCLFLYRRKPAISWLEAIGVLLLFGLAILSKENAVSLAGILILTDTFVPEPFSTSSLRRNWRLYALLLPAALAGAAAVFRMLAGAPTAGFSVSGITPFQYALTQARAIFTYLRLALVPYGQSVDHDFPISRSLFDHGAAFWAILLCFLIVAAVRLRRQWPLTCFGLLFFLIALAPTSSIVPILDPLVERRMYLPLMGLILIGCEGVSRVHLSPTVKWSLAGVALVALSVACHERNRVWSVPSNLFMDAARKSAGNPRPYLNLTEMAVREGRCGAALPYLKRADQLFPNLARVQLAWGWALECLGHRDEALDRLLRARSMQPTSSVYEQLGLLYGEMGRVVEAGDALKAAVTLAPESATAHEALAFWHESIGEFKDAEGEYGKSSSLNPHDPNTRAALTRVRLLQQQHSTQ